MNLNNFFVVFLILLLTLTPIASSDRENDAEENNTLSIENTSSERDKNTSDLESPVLIKENQEAISVKQHKADEENEPSEAVQPVKIKHVNLEQYLPTSNPTEEYEVKKVGNRKYEYVRSSDGKKLNSIDEMDIKSDKTVKLREGFEERLNQSAEKVRLLVSLKIDKIKIQSEIQRVKEEYKHEEDKFKGEIRDISIKYNPKNKKQAMEIAQTKDIIKISDADLDKIKEKGRALEQVKEQEVNEIKEKLFEKTEAIQSDFLDWLEDNKGEVKRELNGIVSIEIPIELLEKVLDRPKVGHVEIDENLIKPFLDVSTPTVSVSNWWSAGYNGSWTDTAVLDTGINATHPALFTKNIGGGGAF